jgi:N-methylhydantoinase B
MFNFFGGGLGGNPEGDGLSHAGNPISTATMPPLEILEAAYPVVFTQWALRPDSAGQGVHRGGLGAIYEIESQTDAEVSLLGERGCVGPFGVVGGESAALNRFFWQTDEGMQSPPLVSKVTGVALKAGHRVRLETPGGGGWGARTARDPQAVSRDLALGYVTGRA